MSAKTEPTHAPDETFARATLGDAVLGLKPVQAFLRWPLDRRVMAVAGALAALLFIPFLGAVGLWDPWETHYGEVARQMIYRNDYVHSYWENAWFFSKSPFTMWMQALGMQLVGAVRSPGPLGLWTEWGFRLPFALFSILAVVLMSLAVTRLASARAGLATAFVLCTMPLYFLLTRQAVTDTPVVAALMCGTACWLIAELDPNTRHRAAWWYGFYISLGVATLAKELLGLGIPVGMLVVYLVLAGIDWKQFDFDAHFDWLAKKAVLPLIAGGVAAALVFGVFVGAGIVDLSRMSTERAAQIMRFALPAFAAFVAAFLAVLRYTTRANSSGAPVLFAKMYQMKLGTGLLVFAAVSFPWYSVMFAFNGVDDESSSFFRRFVHDNILRLFAGVHTTTPGGTFTYFIEQGGFAIFPWVALVPGALALAARLKLKEATARDRLGLVAVIWLVVSWGLIGASATKFHHYVFPLLPPLAILLALFIDELWRDGIAKHGVALMIGLPLLFLVGKDLYTSPKNFTDLFVYNYGRPYPFAELINRPIATRIHEELNAAFLVLALLAAVAAVHFFLQSGRQKVTDKSAALMLALVFGLLTPVFGLVGIGRWPFGGIGSLERLTVQGGLRAAVIGLVLVAAVTALWRSRTALFGAFVAFAFSFALWFNWSHWVDLSHHWTQRDQFWRYYAQRKPGEPITAFLMNWRGETFYSQNEVKQIRDNGIMRQYADQPGREWALVEHDRLPLLRSAVGTDKVVTPIEPGLNNKFVLVTID